MCGLSTIGSIANFIQTSFNNVPDGLSGTNLVAVVDMNRQHVENYVGENIGSNSINAEFQPPIVSLSKADAVDFVQAQAGGEKLRLGELSVEESGEEMSSKFWRDLAEDQLKAIGGRVSFTRVLS